MAATDAGLSELKDHISSIFIRHASGLESSTSESTRRVVLMDDSSSSSPSSTASKKSRKKKNKRKKGDQDTRPDASSPNREGSQSALTPQVTSEDQSSSKGSVALGTSPIERGSVRAPMESPHHISGLTGPLASYESPSKAWTLA